MHIFTYITTTYYRYNMIQRVKFTGTQLATVFRDQLAPYNHFGCDFADAFSGTLFRFPLRSASLARRSEISKRAYTTDDMHGSLESLAKQLAQHLLFLRSVRKIELFVLKKDTREAQLLHEVSSAVTDRRLYRDQRLMGYFDRTSEAFKHTSREEFYLQLQNTPDNQLPSHSHRLSLRITHYHNLRVSDTGPYTDALQPTSSSEVEELEYLVYSGLRGGEAKQMSCSVGLRHLKLLPLGAVAACVRRTLSTDTSAPAPQAFPQILGQVGDSSLYLCYT